MFDLLSPSGVVAAALIAPPGPDIIHALTQLDPAALSDYAQVDFLIAWERQTAWVTAATQHTLTIVGATVETAAARARDRRDPFDMAIRAAHAELAAATRICESYAADRLEIARAGPLTAVQTTLALGKSHHRLKHKTGWTLTRNETTEQATWTSPTGHHYPTDHYDHTSHLEPDLPPGPTTTPNTPPRLKECPF